MTIPYPGSAVPGETRYGLLERRLPGPWNPQGVQHWMTDRRAAIRAAQARIQWENDLLIRVVDEQGAVYWTNEPEGTA